jgi:hypothetical protein
MKPADRADYLATVPVLSRGLIARGFAKTASPRTAIKAKCLDCTHFDRDEVANCTVILCPLHSYRPYQNPRKQGADAPPSAPLPTTGELGGNP